MVSSTDVSSRKPPLPLIHAEKNKCRMVGLYVSPIKPKRQKRRKAERKEANPFGLACALIVGIEGCVIAKWRPYWFESVSCNSLPSGHFEESTRISLIVK